MVSREIRRDDCADDDDAGLHPLSAAEDCARRLNRTCLCDSIKVRKACGYPTHNHELNPTFQQNWSLV
jgi:hypothetical protein